jgi:hypothetical protein
MLAAFPQSTLQVLITGPRQADQALTIQAVGSNAARDLGQRPIDYGLQLIVTDPAILPGDCATAEQAELAKIMTVRGGGSLLTFDDLPEGTGGPFSLREPYEPIGSGPLQVCAYSEWRSEDAASAQANVQITAAPRPPRLLRAPVIHRSENELICSRGRWSGAPTRFTYRWRVAGGHLGPARAGARYEITRVDRGHSVSCSVTARGPGGTTSATSAGVRIG